MWREQDYLHPRALLGYFPCYSEGNEIVVLDPEDRETVLERLVFPRQPNGDRICLADFYRPKDSGELDVVALQAVTAGDEVTELMAELEARRRVRRAALHPRPRRADRRGHGRVAALARSARDLGIPATQGRRYSWGYPAMPGAVRAREGLPPARRPSAIGLRLSGGYAVEPEQSTVAIVAHHPQAIYFGMTSGAPAARRHKGRADDVIKGSPRDPSLFGELDDAELEFAAAESSHRLAPREGALHRRRRHPRA